MNSPAIDPRAVALDAVEDSSGLMASEIDFNDSTWKFGMATIVIDALG